jgi:predicted RNA-binding Zn ribbon-like protein
METVAQPGHGTTDGFLAIEFQHTEVGPASNLPDSPWPINDYGDLLAWARRFGVIGGREARQLRQQARRDPARATEAHARALRIRETLDEVFRTIALGRQPTSAARSALARDEAEALARAELVGGEDGFGWSWAGDKSLGRPLWPVVHDATRLLIDGPLDRVKACDGCRYLFIDESKNRSRRWCDMSTCGTTEKMRRYVERRAAKRAAAQAGSA